MNKNFVWFTIVLLAVFLVLFIFLGKEEVTDAPTDELSPDAVAAKEVGLSFFDDFIAIAPPAEDPDAEGRILEMLSERALDEIDVEMLSRDLALFVGVQDVPDQGVEFEKITIEDDGSASMVVILNYSGGSAERHVLLVKEDNDWKVDSITVKTQADFQKVGNITRDNPGFPAGVWHLTYEAPGEPALTKALIFTDETVCIAGGETGICDPERMEVGARVEIEGKEKEEGVEVMVLRFLEE